MRDGRAERILKGKVTGATGPFPVFLSKPLPTGGAGPGCGSSVYHPTRRAWEPDDRWQVSWLQHNPLSPPLAPSCQLSRAMSLSTVQSRCPVPSSKFLRSDNPASFPVLVLQPWRLQLPLEIITYS